MGTTVKYQNTKIDATESATEIAALIRQHGGTRFEMIWDDDGELEAIRFAIRVEDMGEVPVRLGVQTRRIFEQLWKSNLGGSVYDEERHDLIRKQANRIAWRNLKDYLERALQTVESGLLPLFEVFMAHIEVWDDLTGKNVTMSEYMIRRAHTLKDGRGISLNPAKKDS